MSSVGAMVISEVAARELISKLLTHEKSKNLAEIFNTSVE